MQPESIFRLTRALSASSADKQDSLDCDESSQVHESQFREVQEVLIRAPSHHHLPSAPAMVILQR